MARPPRSGNPAWGGCRRRSELAKWPSGALGTRSRCPRHSTRPPRLTGGPRHTPRPRCVWTLVCDCVLCVTQCGVRRGVPRVRGRCLAGAPRPAHSALLGSASRRLCIFSPTAGRPVTMLHVCTLFLPILTYLLALPSRPFVYTLAAGGGPWRAPTAAAGRIRWSPAHKWEAQAAPRSTLSPQQRLGMTFQRQARTRSHFASLGPSHVPFSARGNIWRQN